MVYLPIKLLILTIFILNLNKIVRGKLIKCFFYVVFYLVMGKKCYLILFFFFDNAHFCDISISKLSLANVTKGRGMET